MIAAIRPHRENSVYREANRAFLALLPDIRRCAKIAFRSCGHDLKEELVAQVIANAFAAAIRLAERGKLDLAYPTVLARYAIRQVRCGRQLGGRLNRHDISSRYAQVSHGVTVDRIDQFDPVAGEWQETLVEDRKAGPAETAAARIDTASWLRSLTDSKRQVAEALALGETTKSAALAFRTSPARISQLRHELRRSWERFQRESRSLSISLN